MKAYETLANIAAADVSEMAQRCKITEDAARAVRACAKLALEDSEKKFARRRKDAEE
jgi:hypothetical protein